MRSPMNTVVAPAVVRRTTSLSKKLASQRLPSGPVVISWGSTMSNPVNRVTVPLGVMRPTASAANVAMLVNQRLPSGPDVDARPVRRCRGR